MKQSKTTNSQLIELIRFLRKKGRENKASIWRDIADRLARPSRQLVAVNLSRLNRYTQKNETVVVSGKVLGSGELNHPITVAAFDFSETARDKITAARGKQVSFRDLVKKNPKGANVKIIG